MSFHLCRLQDGFEGIIAIHDATKYRLSGTCFRGPGVRCAGNFFAFASVQDLLGNPRVLHDSGAIGGILKEMRDILGSPDPFVGVHSFELEWDSMVGWSSTDERKNYDEAMLRRGPVGQGRNGTALFVEPRRLRAPLTNLITIAFTLMRNPKGIPHATIRTIYPGRDVGELVGDVSAREKIVFFDWNHPGVEMSKPTMALQGT